MTHPNRIKSDAAVVLHHIFIAITRIFVVLLFAASSSWAASRQPQPEILGVRLGMPYVAAHSRLARIASFERSEEGQEIWKLKADDRYERLIVGFDAARHVRYVTALAKQDGQPIDYGQIAEVSSAIRASGPGNNVKLTWKARDRKAGFDYLVIAYGHDAHRLSSYSVKRLGARGEEEEEEESTAHTQH